MLDIKYTLSDSKKHLDRSATKLRWFRTLSSFSLDQMAHDTGILKSTLSLLERSLIEPSPKTCKMLSEAFGERYTTADLLRVVTLRDYLLEEDCPR